MTPAQIDHLRRIDAHLAKLLSLAEKRTPGRWIAKYDTSNGWDLDSKLGDRIAVEAWHDAFDSREQHDANAAFIAACAGNAEAGWKATRAAIKGMLRVYDRCDEPTSEYAKETLENILAAFPLEMLETTK